MKILKEQAVFNSAANNLWQILSDVTRCDWIDTVDNIEMEGDCRVFEMAGMGRIKERIIKLDNESMELQYSAVETMAPIKHHLATINISEETENKCLLKWTTEIDPEIFADAIHQGMLISIKGLRKVLDES
ncbi:MAG: SRPBCC family protein [Proteobacteria bacterium]|nr:SRPBCC family protein [Pseudomonadota bacterium]